LFIRPLIDQSIDAERPCHINCSARLKNPEICAMPKAPDNDDSTEDARGGLRFGSDAFNSYASDVGYDQGQTEYTRELIDEEEDEEEVDEGSATASHPSTLQRTAVLEPKVCYDNKEHGYLYTRQDSNAVFSVSFDNLKDSCLNLLLYFLPGQWGPSGRYSGQHAHCGSGV
jgi:hypothetical protein